MAIHDTSRYANNRAEQSHEATRVRERGMRGAASRRFKSTRRHTVEILSDGQARSVSEITGHFSVSRQAVTKHITILNDAGIVACERHGRDRHNQLQPKGLDPLREWLSHYSAFWDDRLAALKQQVEQREES